MYERVRIDAATTDDALAVAFAARLPDALEQTYIRYVDVLYTVARSVAGTSQEAQDCVHDTVLRIWLAPNAYRVERGALRSFLIVCVRNAALSRARAAARHAALERRATQADASNGERFEDIDHVQYARLNDALAALPNEQRAVIDLAYTGQRTQTQIAAQLGLPLGTVKSRVSLALRKLGLALGQPTS